MVKHQCPCGAKYKFEPQHAGKRAKCKRCGAVFVVPTDEERLGMIPIADAPLGLMDEVAAAVQRGAPPPPPVPGPFPPGMTAPPPVVIEPPLEPDEPLAVPGEGRDYASSLAQSFPHHAVTIVEALRDRELFGRLAPFQDLGSWSRWLANTRNA